MRTGTRSRAVSFGVAFIAIAAVACSDPTSPAPGLTRVTSQSRSLQGIDREFAEIARVVPGFAGVSRSSDGSSILFLTDPSRAEGAKQAVAAHSALRGVDLSRIQVRSAKFDYVQLTDWRTRVRQTLDVPGFVFLDIDESSNRLRIGVEKGTSHSLVESQLASMDIPADAVTVEDAEPLRYLATIGDRIRPTMGGIQIAFNSPPDAPTPFVGFCTLSFNARIPGSSETFMVLNSHCSGTQGGLQHTQIFQPTPLPENLVALEHLDPDYSADGCFRHFRCRLSDAALARYLPGVEATVGVIARTTLRGLTAGSLVIDPVQPSFTITDAQPFPLMGQTLDKIGRTTGWTVGTLAFTCIDVNLSGTDIVQLCQDEMFSGNAGGDSGSPIFESQAPFTNDVTLYGILWGGGNTTFGPILVFSPMANIVSELGPLIVTAP